MHEIKLSKAKKEIKNSTIISLCPPHTHSTETGSSFPSYPVTAWPVSERESECATQVWEEGLKHKGYFFVFFPSIFHSAAPQVKCWHGSSGLITLTDSSDPPPSSTALACFALLQGQVSNLSWLESSQPHIFSAKTQFRLERRERLISTFIFT